MNASRIALLAALVLTIPAAGVAQRGGGGRGGRDPEMRRMDNEQGGGVRFATKKDIEQLSPAGFLVDKRKKLQLDDKVVEALKAAETAELARNNALLTTYDSVRREVQKYASGDRPTTENDAAMRQMAFGNLRRQVREAFGVDRSAAIAALPEDKRQAAEDLLKENDKDFDTKLGGGGGGRGRRGG